ncbi:MAG: hypothetical protein HY376_00095 [Candidatus Blackburnbacteria bacterium]|nr:hypothetical protein [Candidatus Blackburnbacteria bacterium]
MMRLYHTISNSAVDEHTPEIQAALKRLEDGYQPKPGPVHPVLIARILRELSDLADDESVNSKVRRRARGLAFQIDMAKGKAEGKVR